VPCQLNSAFLILTQIHTDIDGENLCASEEKCIFNKVVFFISGGNGG